MTNLGRCGAFTENSRCDGFVIAIEHVGSLIEGKCSKCGTWAAVPAAKVDPAISRQQKLQRAELPQKFFGIKFAETEDNRTALDHVRDWIASYHSAKLPAPALWGLPGRGKSHLLTAIGARLIRERDQDVMFRDVRQLLRELQDWENAERTMARACSVDVLLLDDLGVEMATDWRKDQLADVIDSRYRLDKPIVVATNFTPSMWADAADERTASRLRGMTFPVELRGVDRRSNPVGGGVA